jgi:fructose-bisphosphate aldolase class II
VRKVNIDTDLRLASTGSIREFLNDEQNAANFDPRKFYKVATDAMQAICEARFEAFGTAGHADKIHPVSLEKMVQRYQQGRLSPQFSS